MAKREIVHKDIRDILLEKCKLSEPEQQSDIVDHILDSLFCYAPDDPLFHPVVGWERFIPDDLKPYVPPYGAHVKDDRLYRCIDSIAKLILELQPIALKLEKEMKIYDKQLKENYAERQKDPYFSRWKKYAAVYSKKREHNRIQDEEDEKMREIVKYRRIE